MKEESIPSEMLPEGVLPQDVSADYVNIEVETALASLQAEPDYDKLAQLFIAMRTGYLFVDVTGGSTKKKGTRMRTTRTTKGQLVLPIFTSMQALRAAVGSAGRRPTKETKGALMPALEALKLIETDRFVAIEINPGTGALVVLRKYVALILANESINPEQLA